MRPAKKQPSGLSLYVQAEKMLQIAVLLPAAALVGWLVGSWLDGQLHQSWIGLSGILFGGISGLVYVVRLVMISGNRENQPAKGEDGDNGVDPANKQ